MASNVHRDTRSCSDGCASGGVLQGIVVAKSDAEVFGHCIERVRGHLGEEASRDDHTVRIIEFNGRKFVEFHDRPELRQVEWGVVDDDTVCVEEHRSQFWPDIGEFRAVTHIPVSQSMDVCEVRPHPSVAEVGTDKPLTALRDHAVLQDGASCCADASPFRVGSLEIQSGESHLWVLLDDVSCLSENRSNIQKQLPCQGEIWWGYSA